MEFTHVADYRGFEITQTEMTEALADDYFDSWTPDELGIWYVVWGGDEQVSRGQRRTLQAAYDMIDDILA